MKCPVIIVDVNTQVKEVAILMTAKAIGSVIITKDEAPIGIVTKRDIIQRLVVKCGDPCKNKVGDIMSSLLISTHKENGIRAQG